MKLNVPLSLALALGGVTLIGTYVSPDATVLAKEVYTLEQWDKSFEKRLDTGVKNYIKLAKWCESKGGLQWTSTRVRRYVFSLRPEHAETRGYFGYEKLDGKWIQSDLRRDEFRTNFIDENDPNGKKFRTAFAKVVNANCKQFSSAARKADRQAADPELAHEAAEWKQRAVKAWELVLNFRPDTGEDKGLYKQTIKDQTAAHKALGHPKLENGDYVTPFQLRYLKARSERKRRSAETAATDPAVEDLPMDGPMAKAGLTGAGAKGPYATMYTVHGKEIAVRAAKAGEKAVADAVDIYGFPEEVKDRLKVATLYLIDQEKQEEQFRQVLEAGGEKKETVDRLIKAKFGGAGLPGGRSYVSTVTKGKDVEDSAIHMLNKACGQAALEIAAQSVGRKLMAPEDWLFQSMGYDATMRLNGTALRQWGAFGKYGQRVRQRPGQDLWITLARQQVETDDDVPMTQLYVKTLGRQEFRGREIVKGYAFLQFLFEDDEAKAREFIWHALPLGTAHAAMVVYGPDVLGDDGVPEIPKELPSAENRRPLPEKFAQVLNHLEERYKEWIMKSY